MELIEKHGDNLPVFSFAAFRDLIQANRLELEACGIRGLDSCHNSNPLMQ